MPTYPTVTVDLLTDAPCPRVGVTITGLSTGPTTFNVWRTADGNRTAVRGARNRVAVDSDYVIDYEAPFGRPITYEVEVMAGTQAGQPTVTATTQLDSATGWIQDPLLPATAIPISTRYKTLDGSPVLSGDAFATFEYASNMTLVPILGSPNPVALMGPRMAAGNVDFSLFTDAAEQNTQMRNLITGSPLLMVRPLPEWGGALPGSCYVGSAKPAEVPVDLPQGGTATMWQLTGDLVAAPTFNILVPVWTYGDVEDLWSTYQQAQDTLAGKTYLDVLKSPAGI